MNIRAQVWVAAAYGVTLLAGAGCGGGDGGRPASPAGPPAEVMKPLQVPESPYYIIYTPPVSLAKAPDTTSHGRKPRS